MLPWQTLAWTSMLALGALGPPPRLTGTTWSTSYYYYHEDWTFVSNDSVAIEPGQWGWSMPIDTLLPEDSIYLFGAEVRPYSFDGTWLVVGKDAPVDSFRWDGEKFTSGWAYAYGPVILMKGPNADCAHHGR